MVGKERPISSFFKRNRDEPIVEEPQPLIPDNLVELEPRQYEDQAYKAKPIVFRGIEFLQRDPALRPQIWEYPSNQQDEVRRAYLKLGPMQPKLKKYEGFGPQGHKRYFRYSWFGDFPSWLEYSESNGRAYCLLCFVSSKNIKKRSGFDVFTAQGFDSYLTSFEFVFVRLMMREIMEITEQLGQALQKKTQDIVNAIRLVHSTKVLLEEIRSDDGWEKFMCTVVEFCLDHGIDIPDMEATYIMRGGRARRQPNHFTNDCYFRVEIFRATIDTQLAELNLKFNEKVMDLLSISITLIPKNRFSSFNAIEICKMVEKYYPTDFNQQERLKLEYQLKHFVVDASNSEELKHIATIAELCQCLVGTGRHRTFNMIDRLLRLLLTLPVSTATAERVFSILKITKTRLRNRMEDEFLANSLVVHIEGEIARDYSYEDIITDFRDLKKRRVDF